MIRVAREDDKDDVWKIFSSVIRNGDTYVFDPKTPRQDLNKYWFANHMKTFVFENKDEVLGTYILRPNQIDLGSHVANASYMVHPKAHGQGIGKLLCAHSIEKAKELGYQSIQFNLVVSTNKVAVNLWKKFGFEIIGTIPKAFNHKKLDFVDAYVMYRAL